MIFDIKNLKNLRKQLHLTQAEFAKRASVSQSLIAKIEAGKIDPTYSKVQRISEAIARMSHENEIEAKEVMITNVISARPEDKVTGIIRKLHKHAISQMPVIENDKILGIVYEHKILEKSMEKDLKELKAEDVMTEAPPIISADTKMSIATNLLKHFPIILVCKKGKMIGLVSKSDVLKKMI